ncbi:MAG: multiheme C-type cytochrome [Desulfobulbaceae bacterium]|nr:multiheme C-type cytochrome [Desulfobulbaceae bacterium]
MLALQAAEQEQHPELEPGEQYIPCAQCHQEVTPELYTEWNASLHGIGMVACYQCHGTFENFRVTPLAQDCAACHADRMDAYSQDQPCWSCHVPHSFKAEGASAHKKEISENEKPAQ